MLAHTHSKFLHTREFPQPEHTPGKKTTSSSHERIEGWCRSSAHAHHCLSTRSGKQPRVHTNTSRVGAGLAHRRITAGTHAREQQPRVHTNALRGWCRFFAHKRVTARAHAREQHPRVHTNASRGWCRFFAHKRVTARAHAREQALEFTRTQRGVGAGLAHTRITARDTRPGKQPHQDPT